MRTLKDVLEGYEPNTKDEAEFINKHKPVDKKADRNGNGDDVFQATNVKKINRNVDKHGYNPGQDEAVHEEVEQLIERALKPGQKVHRQELAKLIRKANPHIDPEQAYAMAVATARRVEESVEPEQLEEKHLTPNEKSKKEEIVKAIKRENPNMNPGKAYAIATATAKKVTEEVEELDEVSNETLKSYVHKASNDRTKQLGNERKYNNRLKGVSSAVKKMNENIEDDQAQAWMDHEDLLAKVKSKKHKKSFSDEFNHHSNLFNHHYENEDDDQAEEALSSMEDVNHQIRKHLKQRGLSEAKSLTSGMRVISKHEGKDGYHTEVRHNKDWDEYQVHHYHNGKHLGEGPVSYHDNKADAKETAEWSAKNNHVKNGKVMTEEAEQLDELSRAAVKGYISLATADLETNKRVLASTAKKTGRSLDDVYDDPKSSNLTHRQYKRYRGIDTATGKIQPNDKWTKVRATNEEVEQIDEISKEKVGEYIRRSANDVEDRAYWAGRNSDQKKHPYTSYPNKKQDQRMRGIGMAIKKLTKEDIINRTIEKFLPEAPASAEEIFESRIENLPENHRSLLNGLFESLSDVNKLTMLDKMNTEEGINDLLDFAIHARGA